MEIIEILKFVIAIVFTLWLASFVVKSEAKIEKSRKTCEEEIKTLFEAVDEYYGHKH